MSLEELYIEAADNNIDIDYFPMNSLLSLSLPNGHIAINAQKIDSFSLEKICLAHEMGHCLTGSFYKIHSPLDVREKHERRADAWAIKKLVPIDKLTQAVEAGYLETWELAEYFDVPGEFMHKALNYYQDIQGLGTNI